MLEQYAVLASDRSWSYLLSSAFSNFKSSDQFCLHQIAFSLSWEIDCLSISYLFLKENFIWSYCIKKVSGFQSQKQLKNYVALSIHL